jgi:uncharacterized protein YecT (DUF1311 family)
MIQKSGNRFLEKIMREEYSRAAVVFALCALLAAPALAQDRPDARASKTIQDCVKSKSATGMAETCIGIVSGPCLERNKASTTADMVNCVAGERAVWDDILNETFRRLRDKLDDERKTKLREMQRAWIAARDTTCNFYWDYYQGTMAHPMRAECVNRQTAERALFLLGFLNDAEGK